MRRGARLCRVKTLIAGMALVSWLMNGGSAAGAEPGAQAVPTVIPWPAPPTATPLAPPGGTAPAVGRKLLDNQQLFGLLDRVQNILIQKKVPRDGTATPDQLSDELTMVELALANAADKTGEAAQAGYIMHASMQALCGRLTLAEDELLMVINHGSGQGRLAAYKEMAEVLLQAGKANALDELAARGEREQIPVELSGHMRMFANFLHVKVGEGFPSFTIADTSGAMHTLADYQGHVLILDFWASWCQPNMDGLAPLMRTYQRFHPHGVEMLGVCLDDNLQILQEIVKMSGMSWPQALETRQFNSPLLIRYGVWGLPANFVIGPDGTLIAKNIHGNALDQLLTKLSAQP